jgi:hypothetical protein
MTQPKLRIKNPSLTLYAFHLRHDAMGLVDEAPHLWEKLTQLSEYFSAPELQELPAQLMCYQNGNYYPEGELGQRTEYLQLMRNEWHFSSSLANDLTRSGSVYPVRLHDTYAVDFTVYYPDKMVDIKQLAQLNPQGCLMPSFIQASLGQTLLLYGEPSYTTISEQEFAERCVKALFTETHALSLSRQGQLFGSALFEFEMISPPEATPPNKLIHILVWLGKHWQTLELAGRANPWLINLLNCRHKILFAYYEARQSNNSAHKTYRALEKDSEQLNKLPTVPAKRLASLETVLYNTSNNTFEYARHLRNLTDQHTTIVINTTNYIKWLSHIREICLPSDEFTFLDDFGKKTSQHYQQQITFYLDYLKPGRHLFEQLTTTTLGLVNLGEQKQQMIRAENFEFLITFIGATVGTGAISATVIPDPPHLIEVVVNFFELIQLPLPPVEMPEWFDNFPILPDSIFKIMFHLIIGGVTALFFTPLISLILKILRKQW